MDSTYLFLDEVYGIPLANISLLFALSIRYPNKIISSNIFSRPYNRRISRFLPQFKLLS
jgi:hypothetical protein